VSRPAAYRPEIDGLRCIAVLSVILYHAGLPGFRGGFVGVDIFFVISGFLITGIVHGELRRGTFSLRGFYERRLRRIFPALALMLAVTAAVAWFVLTPGQYKAFGQSLVACVAFLSNIYFYFRTDYFAPQAEELPLLHTWSLAVEEQFYLVFPALLWAAMRWSPKRVLAIVAAMAAASLALCLYRQAAGSDALNFFDAASRAWQLAAGALLAIAIADVGPGGRHLPRATRAGARAHLHLRSAWGAGRLAIACPGRRHRAPAVGGDTGHRGGTRVVQSASRRHRTRELQRLSLAPTAFRAGSGARRRSSVLARGFQPHRAHDAACMAELAVCRDTFPRPQGHLCPHGMGRLLRRFGIARGRRTRLALLGRDPCPL
jgi:hypothetical protein